MVNGYFPMRGAIGNRDKVTNVSDQNREAFSRGCLRLKLLQNQATALKPISPESALSGASLF